MLGAGAQAASLPRRDVDQGSRVPRATTRDRPPFAAPFRIRTCGRANSVLTSLTCSWAISLARMPQQHASRKRTRVRAAVNSPASVGNNSVASTVLNYESGRFLPAQLIVFFLLEVMYAIRETAFDGAGYGDDRDCR